MTEAQKAKHKIQKAEWYQKNKEKASAQSAKWKKDNPNKVKLQNAKFKEKNPNYIQPSATDLDYFVVYVIKNFNSLGNDYAGQTRNLYKRMNHHKCIGKLNTETYEVLEKFDNVDEALGFELTLHLAGYHGKQY